MPASRKSRASAAAAAPPADSDADMADATGTGNGESSQADTNAGASAAQQPENPQIESGEEEFFIGDEDPDVLKIRILPGETESSASYEFLNEDHTLGNALRYMIMKNPDVEFCGYSIPHPSDPKMNLRIQTYDDSTSTPHEILDKGLDDLMGLCDVVLEKFEGAVEESGQQQ